jgi:hypothetical protein
MALGHMCNVNMCIMSCNRLCFVGSWKTLFIIAHGVAMKFNICVATLASGLRPRQGVTRLQAKKETQESLHMLPGVQKV